MAFAPVSKVYAVGAAPVTSSAIDTTGATLLVAVCAQFGGTGVYAVSDSKSNTWTGIQNYTQGSQNIEIFYAVNPSVGAGHTFTLGGALAFPTIAVSAWSAAALASPRDQQTGAGAAAAPSIQPGSVTPLQSNELVITGVASNAVNGWTINAGFTLLNTLVVSNVRVQDAYLIQTSAVAANPTFTTSAGSADQAAAIATFKALALAGGGLLLMGCGS